MKVSCVMPTHNRRKFIPRAINFFLAQDWPNKELIIYDNGSDCVADLVPNHSCITYFYAPTNRELGWIRNVCAQLTTGDVICHFDDDDWQSPDRISKQVTALKSGDYDICGLRDLYFVSENHEKAWFYQCPASIDRYVIGGSTCFYKEFWEKHPFPIDFLGEYGVGFFKENQDVKLLTISDPTIFLATVHDGNTDKKLVDNIAYTRISINDVKLAYSSLNWPDFSTKSCM